jgi:O-antigen ligase
MTPFLIPILNLFSDKIEITSRTLNMIMEGNIADFSTRINLYKTTWSSILEQPFVGHGLYSDRIILDGSYSHNIFLELFHNFGLIIGSALIAILLLKVMRVYYLSDRNQKKLLILFLFYGFVPLLVSQSYLNYAPFGLFIGSLIHLSYRYDHSNPKVVPSQGLNKIIP